MFNDVFLVSFLLTLNIFILAGEYNGSQERLGKFPEKDTMIEFFTSK